MVTQHDATGRTVEPSGSKLQLNIETIFKLYTSLYQPFV